ncbi:hypothetical protein DPMN_150132 [Dreissena polymorpha]|uniref:Uncharacterized protein n=1 Tax=Dreissena polymorpha TaxID=45954 RepID=A0A9D4J5N7_DREPO|nr:hypothetical protein DPMN_150132 [Dreissena polymorpha]
MDMETYMTSAICTERTEVLVLEMKHYERLFVKKHQRTIDVMRRRIEVKLNTRTSVLKVLVHGCPICILCTQLYIVFFSFANTRGYCTRVYSLHTLHTKYNI